MSPLESLASLHELSVRCNGAEPNGLDKLKASLSPWDKEFRAAKPKYTPSLELHVVDQQTFDIYDTKKPFNVGGPLKSEALDRIGALKQMLNHAYNIDRRVVCLGD